MTSSVVPVIAGLALLALAACDLPPPDPARVAAECEQRARAAQGPTGSVTLGVNSNTGPYAGAEIGLSSDFLAGRDPIAVYEQCVLARTGQPPIRPPNLR
jgi:hypothetical protein